MLRQVNLDDPFEMFQTESPHWNHNGELFEDEDENAYALDESVDPSRYFNWADEKHTMNFIGDINRQGDYHTDELILPVLIIGEHTAQKELQFVQLKKPDPLFEWELKQKGSTSASTSASCLVERKWTFQFSPKCKVQWNQIGHTILWEHYLRDCQSFRKRNLRDIHTNKTLNPLVLYRGKVQDIHCRSIQTHVIRSLLEESKSSTTTTTAVPLSMLTNYFHIIEAVNSPQQIDLVSAICAVYNLGYEKRDYPYRLSQLLLPKSLCRKFTRYDPSWRNHHVEIEGGGGGGGIKPKENLFHMDRIIPISRARENHLVSSVVSFEYHEFKRPEFNPSCLYDHANMDLFVYDHQMKDYQRISYVDAIMQLAKGGKNGYLGNGNSPMVIPPEDLNVAVECVIQRYMHQHPEKKLTREMFNDSQKSTDIRLLFQPYFALEIIKPSQKPPIEHIKQMLTHLYLNLKEHHASKIITLQIPLPFRLFVIRPVYHTYYGMILHDPTQSRVLIDPVSYTEKDYNGSCDRMEYTTRMDIGMVHHTYDTPHVIHHPRICIKENLAGLTTRWTDKNRLDDFFAKIVQTEDITFGTPSMVVGYAPKDIRIGDEFELMKQTGGTIQSVFIGLNSPLRVTASEFSPDPCFETQLTKRKVELHTRMYRGVSYSRDPYQNGTTLILHQRGHGSNAIYLMENIHLAHRYL